MSVRNDPQRREAILEAAWACFVQHGYAKTSLEDVARRAGLSRPLIYLHFANKNELFGCVIENLVHGYYEAASAVLALEAFRLAGDRKAFPEQLATLRPWQPRRGRPS